MYIYILYVSRQDEKAADAEHEMRAFSERRKVAKSSSFRCCVTSDV